MKLHTSFTSCFSYATENTSDCFHEVCYQGWRGKEKKMEKHSHWHEYTRTELCSQTERIFCLMRQWTENKWYEEAEWEPPAFKRKSFQINRRNRWVCVDSPASCRLSWPVKPGCRCVRPASTCRSACCECWRWRSLWFQRSSWTGPVPPQSCSSEDSLRWVTRIQ